MDACYDRAGAFDQHITDWRVSLTEKPTVMSLECNLCLQYFLLYAYAMGIFIELRFRFCRNQFIW